MEFLLPYFVSVDYTQQGKRNVMQEARKNENSLSSVNYPHITVGVT